MTYLDHEDVEGKTNQLELKTRRTSDSSAIYMIFTIIINSGIENIQV